MKPTPAQIAEWTRLRELGKTIEEVALEVGVPSSTIQRYTPKGIHNRSTKPRHDAKVAEAKDQSYLEPKGRIVNEGFLRRHYR